MLKTGLTKLRTLASKQDDWGTFSSAEAKEIIYYIDAIREERDKLNSLSYDWTQDVGPGWKNIVQLLVDKCRAEGIAIGQVKEKFGGLRFYIDGEGSEELANLIYNAEKKSYTVCEFCGAPGEARYGDWIKTLCDACDEVREEKRKNAM